MVKSLVFLVLFFMITFACNMVQFRYEFSDAFFATLLWPVEDTRWAEGFSERKFDLAARSSNEDEVIKILGKPLVKVCSDLDRACSIRYTWTGQLPCCRGYEGYFHRREFDVDLQGHLLGSRREFDLD